MSTRLDKRLKSLWTHPLAKHVKAHKLLHQGEAVKIKVNNVYYFSNEDTKSNPNPTHHELWKGLVLGIRTLPADLSTEALVKVQWFWSKDDIEELFEKKEIDIPDCMRRALDSMGDMELCPSLDTDINLIGCIHSIADIVELTVDPRGSLESGSRLEVQTYIAEYFYRSGFDEHQLTLRGHYSTLGCGKEGCMKGWNPDQEEQRYCYTCRLWFHTSCLIVADGKSQNFLIEKARMEEDCEELPQILLQMAYQPAARGGERHFTAGNIRIVTKGRELVRDKEKRREFTGGKDWEEDHWRSGLSETFKIEKEDERRLDREQLVLYGQMVYCCATCGDFL